MKKIRSDIEVESARTRPAGMIAPSARRFLEKARAQWNVVKLASSV